MNHYHKNIETNSRRRTKTIKSLERKMEPDQIKTKLYVSFFGF